MRGVHPVIYVLQQSGPKIKTIWAKSSIKKEAKSQMVPFPTTFFLGHIKRMQRYKKEFKSVIDHTLLLFLYKCKNLNKCAMRTLIYKYDHLAAAFDNQITWNFRERSLL
jgi:hypothetical protein